MELIKEIAIAFWELSLEMAPYLLLGFIFAGLLNGVIKKSRVQKILGRQGISSAIKAAILGIPLPLCSCGVIPTGIAFHQGGASKSATVSFLISTPQTGVDSILVTYSMMGGGFAIIRPIIALITGVAGGIATYFSKNEKNTQKVETNTDEKNKSWFDRVVKYAFVEFMQDISRWLLIGLALAAVITVVIPESLFTQYLDTPLLNMLVILAVSVPLYVCATGSVPIAAALIMKGLSPGAALVFLMAGPATNAATLTVLWKSIGKKTTLIYLATILISSITFGLIIDYLLPANWFIIPEMAMGSGEHHAHDFLPWWLTLGSTIVLFLLLINAEGMKFYNKYFRKNNTVKEEHRFENTLKVTGMTCNHCKSSVEDAVRSTEGIGEFEVVLEHNEVRYNGDIDQKAMKKAIEDRGYSCEI